MELDRKILAYVAYRASRSALLTQLNEMRLTVEAINEVIKRLNIPPKKKAEADRFFIEAQQDFGQMLKDSFEKVKEETLKTAEAYLKDSTKGD
jgi:flagellar hook-basal body complex protein FliE